MTEPTGWPPSALMQDDALIQQLEEALTDIVEAGEEAWGKDRPCVRIGKEAITAARARLGEKT